MTPEPANKAPSSPVETTDAPARPIPPEALNGLTGAAYTDVIRREAETFLIQEGVINKASLDTIVRLTKERDEARAALKAERVISRSRNATIERLWAQLNEATNVPAHNDPEFGFDKTAALSESTTNLLPVAPRLVVDAASQVQKAFDRRAL